MSERSQLDIIKHRGVRPWTLEIPDRDRAVRSATREADSVLVNDRKYGMLLAALGLFAIVIFVLAFEFDGIDWIRFW
jgi:hypothetical protein